MRTRSSDPGCGAGRLVARSHHIGPSSYSCPASRPCHLPPLTCPYAELASRAGRLRAERSDLLASATGIGTSALCDAASTCAGGSFMRMYPCGFPRRCGGAAAGTGAERHAYVRPGCIPGAAGKGAVLVAVFLTNCCRTEWLLASERHGGRESAVASKARLYCCTLPSPATSFSVSRVCLLSASGEARAEGVAGRADARTCWRELVAGGLTRERGVAAARNHQSPDTASLPPLSSPRPP